jgi:hypothetical protein
VDSLLAATLYQGNHDRNHKFWEIYTPCAIAAGMLLHKNLFIDTNFRKSVIHRKKNEKKNYFNKFPKMVKVHNFELRLIKTLDDILFKQRFF